MPTRSSSTPLASRLVFWFAFLGPVGKLIPIPGMPHSFRIYYLLLIPGIFFYLYRGISRRTFNHLLLMVPVVAYMTISSVFAYLATADTYQNAEEGNPLIRMGLLIVLLLFTMCAGEQARTFDVTQKISVLWAFMKGYLCTLIAGYIFFVGYYAHVFTLAFLTNFEVLVQTGFGLLRFSPGSYPNEYGIVSSFALSVLTLFLSWRNRLILASSNGLYRFSLFATIAAYLLTLGALFLATTRAAYISYLLSLLYITFTQKTMRKKVVFGGRIVIGALLLLACVEPFFNVLRILEGGYNAFFNRENMANGRFNAWALALKLFLSHPYVGAGFGSVDMMHNVYLQMLFGLGIIGFSILLATSAVLLLHARGFRLDGLASAPITVSEAFLRRVRDIGLIHVTWFALSNHNLNHFLTWYVVLLVFLCLPAIQPSTTQSPLATPPTRLRTPGLET
ncbi:MAG TPA: O-antigen ligase family protein [Granulicella sp.]|nr:O-antigen ligase family protein [Granulicella sp.]